MIEYKCLDCNYSELESRIIPYHRCPKCNQLLNAEEE